MKLHICNISALFFSSSVPVLDKAVLNCIETKLIWQNKTKPYPNHVMQDDLRLIHQTTGGCSMGQNTFRLRTSPNFNWRFFSLMKFFPQVFFAGSTILSNSWEINCFPCILATVIHQISLKLVCITSVAVWKIWFILGGFQCFYNGVKEKCGRMKKLYFGQKNRFIKNSFFCLEHLY